ncbi:DUF6252 family protein [Lishizhenia sp.]|uniref:DUF6252 family protein n=1 Tax=Lishizhenia sp. TaxID=2497594 RepID=UPI00299CDB30|nr:DUF6252 family protein [Lishizhenia sp.]MDX1444794.1 DUF6252 family protein [Lishizhenia sp.]
MNKYTPLFILLVFGLFFSCKKKVDEPSDNGTGGGGSSVAAKSFKAEVNGNLWQATDVTANFDNGLVTLSGSNGSASFSFSVNQEGQGSYLSPTSVSTMSYTAGSTASEDIEGTLVISSIDTGNKRISGTFSGQTNNGIQITLGEFTSIPYSGVYSGAGIPVTQTGAVNLDGVAFNPDILTGNQGFGRIAINLARGSDNYTVGLNLIESIAAGEYALSGQGDYKASFSTSGALNDQYVAGNGTLRIIAHNTQNSYLVGEFDFTAVPSAGSTSTNTYTLSGGEFGINY